MSIPIVSNTIVGRERVGIPNSRYMVQQTMPDPRRGIVMKSDTGAPLEMASNGQTYTRKYYLSNLPGVFAGPVVNRKGMVTSPYANAPRYIRGWMKQLPNRTNVVISPTQAIMARRLSTNGAVKQAQRTSMAHGIGSYLTAKPGVGLGAWDAFSVKSWNKTHGLARPEPISNFYARQS